MTAHAAAGDQLAMVLGTGRCGSTLVHEILARHDGVGFVSNLDDRFGIRTRRSHVEAYRRLPPTATRKGRLRLAPSEAYRALTREVSPLLADSVRDLTVDDLTPWLARRLETFFHRRRHAQHYPHFLHKFTGWPRAGLIDAVFPDTRFVVVVRDGRAVANSWLQMPWWRGNLGPEGWHFGPLDEHLTELWERTDRSFAALAGLAWRVLDQAYTAAAANIPGERWLDVRFEDVVADPAEAFKQILDFVGLPWNPAFARKLDEYEFRTDRLDAYRADLTAGQLADLEQVIAPTLAAHDYV